jgi:hypothetical protein
MKVDAPTAQLLKILSQMAQQSQAALIAGTKGDEISTRHAVDALRTLRSKLGSIDQDVHSHLERLPQHHLNEISEHLSQINSANFFIQSWCQRYKEIAKVEDLTRSVQGRHAILDYTLPLDWNFVGDVFILFDKEELAFVPKLNQRGQKRIVMVGPQLEIDPQVHANVNSVPDAVALREYFVGLDYPYPARLAFLNPQSQDLESQTWKDVLHAFTFAATNLQTIKALGMLWMTQGLANLKSVALSANIASLKSHLKGFPVVIVSPGPSLDKNIHLLKALKGRAILMAAAQCAGALEAAGVVPDFIVVADPGNLVYMLDGVDASKINGLIVGVASHPDFFKLPFENIITFNANGPIDTWISDIFGDNAPISSAASVSIDCCMLAKYLECSSIIMVGLDLAISEGKIYSKHSANSACNVICDEGSKTMTFANVPTQMENTFLGTGRNSKDLVETLLTLPGYYGGIVQTRPNYYSFHRGFVEFAKHELTEEHSIPLINCTEGGAFIEGFQNVPLETAIAEFIPETKINFAEKIENACQSMNRKLRIDQYVKAKSRFVESIERTLDLVATCKALAVKPKLNQKHRNKLNKSEKKLIHSVRQTPFLSLPNHDQINRVTEMTVNTSTVTEINKVALQLYDTVEVIGNQALRILMTGPTPPPTDLSGAKL